MEGQQNLNCFILSVNRFRQVLRWLGISFIFIWIIFSSYYQTSTVNTKRSVSSPSFQGRGRHLLSVDTPDCNNKSFENCDCSHIHNLDQDSFCIFVINATTCGGDEGFIPYFELVYCDMPFKLLPLSMIILAIWLLYLFLFLGTTASEFFCKALTVITKLLRLSQNVAGVTLLAIGNGAPDIFSVMAAFNHPDEKRTSLAFGALFGAGMFVTTTVVGGVVLIRPFNLTKRPFMRDNIFYMFAVYWALYVLWENKLSIGVAIGFLAVYVSYVILVVLGSFLYRTWNKRKLNTLQLDKKGTVTSGVVRYTNGSGQSDGEVVVETDVDLDSDESERRLSVIIRHTEPPPRTPPPRTPSLVPGPIQQLTPNTTPLYTGTSNADNTTGNTSTGVNIDTSNTDNIDTTNTGIGDGESNAKNGNNGDITTVETLKKEERGEEKEDIDFDDIRPMTPSERSASRASQSVYGTDKDDTDIDQKDYNLAVKPVTPRPPSRLEKVIDGVVHATEDLMVGGNPNLAKFWSQAYGRDGRESSTEYISANEDTKYESLPSSPTSPISPASKKSSHQEEAIREQTPLLRRRYLPPRKSFKERQWAAFLKLVFALFPFRREQFFRLSILQKIFFIIKFPISLVLTATIPVIDNNLPLNNWNRWLSILHCITAPVFASATTEVGLKSLGNSEVPAILIVFIAGLILAVIVALTSHDHKPPIYHCVFAWAGFILSVIWIYTIANEIVNLLQVFGVVIKLSDGILGITLLAWGNSIQDTVTNLTMAKQGFPRMAVGACFGGPLLNLLIGVGLASVVKIISEKTLEFDLYFTQVEMLAAFFLLFSLSSSLLIMSCLGFRMYRPYSVILFTIYITFLIVVILAELEVINIQMSQLSPL